MALTLHPPVARTELPPTVVRDAVEVVDRPVPRFAHDLTDADYGHSLRFGLIWGSLVMTVVAFLMSFLAGVELWFAVAIAPWPGIVSGLFFGSAAHLAYQLRKLECG